MTSQQALDQLRELFPDGYISVCKREEISWQWELSPDMQTEYSIYDGHQHYYGDSFEECFYYLEKEAELEQIRAKTG